MKLLNKLMKYITKPAKIIKGEVIYIYHCEDGLAVINEKTCVVNRQITIGNKIYAINNQNDLLIIGEQEEYKEGNNG